MKLAIMQPYLFPYIGYFQLIQAVDKFVLLDDVNYINRGWINRNRILVQGKAHIFTIPLQKASQNKLIKDMFLVPDVKWKRKLLKTFAMSYKKASAFNDFFPVLTEIINYDEMSLSKYIYQSLVKITAYLNISIQVVESSTIYGNKHLKGAQRILDVCRKEQATHYINPIGGMRLYLKEQFQQKGIVLHFLRTRLFEYPQLAHEFIPSLSIIDVLMCNSISKIQSYLFEYELI